MAPAFCVAHACAHARRLGLPYHLVYGRPAADAKNEAVDIARSAGASLLLVEDDVIAPEPVWDAAAADISGAVLVAGARCRNGEWNVYRGASGEITYAGSVFLLIPAEVIEALGPEPLFVPTLFRPVPGLPRPDRVEPIGPDHSGCGSDVYFWWRLRTELPEVDADEIGAVRHIRHEHNQGGHILCRPHTFGEF